MKDNPLTFAFASILKVILLICEARNLASKVSLVKGNSVDYKTPNWADNTLLHRLPLENAFDLSSVTAVFSRPYNL